LSIFFISNSYLIKQTSFLLDAKLAFLLFVILTTPLLT
jgi:hypothetical protein